MLSFTKERCKTGSDWLKTIDQNNHIFGHIWAQNVLAIIEPIYYIDKSEKCCNILHKNRIWLYLNTRMLSNILRGVEKNRELVCMKWNFSHGGTFFTLHRYCSTEVVFADVILQYINTGVKLDNLKDQQYLVVIK